MLILWRSIINPSVGPSQFSPNKSTLSIQNKQSSNPSIICRKNLASTVELSINEVNQSWEDVQWSQQGNQFAIQNISWNFAVVFLVISHNLSLSRVFESVVLQRDVWGTLFLLLSYISMLTVRSRTIKRINWLNYPAVFKQSLIAHIISKLQILGETNKEEIGIKELRFAIVVIEVRRSVASEKLSH